jgi:benzoyl-CoA reductase/2-hydroxyglutaryl-CoA dehydratase subunit BcrC/BadD/HgdB
MKRRSGGPDRVLEDLLGPAALRVQRWRNERRARSGAGWDSRVLAPPLVVAARSKELVARHWLEGRTANRHHKVAWVTSAAPVELLHALGYFTVYPENHGAICGAARVAVDLACEAENAGYSRDLCSYARTDLGSLFSGRTPVGRLPRPDVLLACTNICQTVLFWYRVLAHRLRVPLVLIDTPFVYHAAAPDHAVAYVRRQIEDAVPVLERIAGRTLAMDRLRTTGELSRQAAQLWMEIMERNAHRPAPISVVDQFTLMAPVVEMRGAPATVDFYGAMLREVDARIAAGVSAVRDEKHRLLWDNLPVWYRLKDLAEALGAGGAALVASTYTNAWGELAELIRPDEPLESLARTYLYPILNRGTGHKLQTMRRMIERYGLDGVLLHSDRSCKPYSIGQLDQRDRLARQAGVPALLLEADHNDSRCYSEAQVANRVAAFLETLERPHG